MLHLIKKNFWLLYLFIVSIGFAILLSIIFTLTNQTINKYQLEQENITKITANSFKSIFNQYEMLLDTIDINLHNYNQNFKYYTNEIIKVNPAVISIEINDDNLVKNKDFEIQRTYYDKDNNKIIVPIQKTYETKNKSYTIKINLDITKAFDFFINNHQTNTNHDTFLFRSEDRYFQFAPKKDFFNKNIYNYQIPKKLIEKGIKTTEKNYNQTIKELMKEEKVVSIKTEDERNVFHSSMYLNKYELWVTTQMPFSLIKKELTKKTILLTILFVFILTIIYYLFKIISKEEKKKQDALYYQATHDSLTGVYNRDYLHKLLDIDKNYSIFFIDVDNFKNINDNFGHFIGDQLLKTITSRLNKLINKKNDQLIRYSGDEFIIIRKQTDKKELTLFAQTILENISSKFRIDPYEINTTVSIGIAKILKDCSLQDIIINADMAMYNAKKTKNSFSFYQDDIKKIFQEKALLENELKSENSKSEFFMVYQPQIDNKNKIYGVEALIRWNNENLGFVNPEIFIRTAEEIGLINSLGKFIINSSLKDIKEIQKKTNKKLKLSINISAKQFVNQNFIEELIEAINLHNFDKELLTLEITESLFIENFDHVLKIIKEIKKHNIKISLDDFGTGYSSLSLLKKLPIDELKIDKSFVDDILTKQTNEKIVKTIISIAKEFNMKVVAEGVERVEQKVLLSKLKCDLIQGYYYSKPIKKDELFYFIEKNHKE